MLSKKFLHLLQTLALLLTLHTTTQTPVALAQDEPDPDSNIQPPPLTQEPQIKRTVKMAEDEFWRSLARGDGAMLKVVLHEGKVDINRKGPGGQTPIMLSCLKGNTDIVSLLLEYGADITIPENSGYTCMHGVGFQGRDATLELLLQQGLERDIFHEDGFAPFHRACWGGDEHHTKTVATFLRAGTPVGLKTKDGKECKDITPNQGTKDLVRKYERFSKAKKAQAEINEAMKKFDL